MQATIVGLLFSLGATHVEASYSFRQRDRIVEFGLYYPITQLKPNFSRRNRGGAAGVHVHYQFFVHRNFAFSLYPNVWLAPLWYRSEPSSSRQRAMLYSMNLEVGGVFRPFPDNYFDPSLYLSSGVARMDAGSGVDARWAVPVTSRIGFNLWRQMDRFKDYNLAFHVYGGARYHLRGIEAIRPLVFDFGIAFRGSF
ncbi:MAG: hypothetical protein EA369_01250 [Bradymonadales bacterium]|nr:MAG: hypothetical protein EA369_01250 [Bradymonadales bacterium]